MLTIQVQIDATTFETVAMIPDLPDELIVYIPCGYCSIPVRAPRKFCCASHRVIYCQKQIGVTVNGRR